MSRETLTVVDGVEVAINPEVGQIKDKQGTLSRNLRYPKLDSHFPITRTTNAQRAEFSFAHFVGQQYNNGLKMPEGVTIDSSDVERASYVEGRKDPTYFVDYTPSF
jgi:ribosomal protein L6P/L9E